MFIDFIDIILFSGPFLVFGGIEGFAVASFFIVKVKRINFDCSLFFSTRSHEGAKARSFFNVNASTFKPAKQIKPLNY
jgi:hypothetical protein